MSVGCARLLLAFSLIGAALVAPRAEANRFRDNPEHPVDRVNAPWAAPIGELQSKVVVTKPNKSQVDEFAMLGSGFLVSPCYILTAAHTVYGDELSPTPGKDYSMWFRAGETSHSSFAGKTTATPVISGSRDAAGSNDWALMRLNTCIGGRTEFGWFERGRSGLDELRDKQIIALGYDGLASRGSLSLGPGRVFNLDRRQALYRRNASFLSGESGGPVLTIESGCLVVSGMNVAHAIEDHGVALDHYSEDTANLIMDVTEVLKKPYIRYLLDSDKAAFGKPNPAAERQRMDRLPR